MKFWWAQKSDHVSLITMQVIVPALFFLASTVLLGLYIASTFYANHLRQEQMLAYIEFERISDSISRGFDKLATSAFNSEENKSVFSWTEQGLVATSGLVSEIPQWETIKPQKLVVGPFILQILGRSYIAEMKGTLDGTTVPTDKPFALTITLAPFPIDRLIQLTRVPLDSSIVYLLSKEGQLIFSTSTNINHNNFQTRPVVQKFVQNQISASGLEFTEKNGKKGFGYSFYIAGSNLVMFAEVSSEAQIKSFSKDVKYSLLVAFFCTFVFGIGLYLIHRKVYLHLKDLALSMEKSALTPTPSEMSPTKIKELAFLKYSYRQNENRLLGLYQKVKDQKNGERPEPVQDGSHEKAS